MKIVDVIENSSIDLLINKGVISEPSNYQSMKNHTTTIDDLVNGGKKVIKQLTLPEMIDYCFDLTDLVIFQLLYYLELIVVFLVYSLQFH